MPISMCHFHTDETPHGRRLSDGSYEYVCERPAGHPGDQVWRWLEAPPALDVPGLAGLAEELRLDVELPLAIESLGEGWFEYGLVERAYAVRRPDDFAVMVTRWGHTAQGPRQYSVSSYLAATLGRLSRTGAVAYHDGVGTGRWDYNADISWWSTPPGGDWSARTSWHDVVGAGDQGDAACLAYVSTV